MGFKKVAKQYKTSVEELKLAKKIYYKLRDNADIEDNVNFFKDFPKILIFDIETAPMKAFVWRRWKQNIYLDQTISEWFMISWAAKWLYDPHVMSGILTPEEIKKEDDTRIVRSIWQLIDEADIIIGHNCKKFDT